MSVKTSNFAKCKIWKSKTNVSFIFQQWKMKFSVDKKNTCRGGEKMYSWLCEYWEKALPYIVIIF